MTRTTTADPLLTPCFIISLYSQSYTQSVVRWMACGCRAGQEVWAPLFPHRMQPLLIPTPLFSRPIQSLQSLCASLRYVELRGFTATSVLCHTPCTVHARNTLVVSTKRNEFGCCCVINAVYPCGHSSSGLSRKGSNIEPLVVVRRGAATRPLSHPPEPPHICMRSNTS